MRLVLNHRICDRFREQRLGSALNKTYVYLTVVFGVKILLSAITPLSADFVGNVLYSQSSWPAILSSGLFAPWFAFMKAITLLWAALPIGHVSVEYNIGFWYIRPNLSTSLLLMMQKAPLLAFDAATAVMIGRIVAAYRSAHVAQQAVLLWLINPYVTLTTEMWGTWDIVAAFFLIAAVAAFAKSRFLESGICLGLGIAVKVYPLLSLPIFLLFLTREKIRSSLRLIVGVAGAYFVTGGVLMIFAKESHVAAANTLSQVSFFGGWVWGYTLEFNIATGFNVGISILAVAAFLFMLGYFPVWYTKRTSILEAVACLYLLVFAFSYWEPHFLLILLPLLTVFYFTSGKKKLPFVAYMSSALVFVLLNEGFYWTSYGHSFFFIPNYDQVLQHYSNLLLFIRQWPIGGGDVNTLITTPIRSLFAAASLYYFAWIFFRNCDKQILRRILGRAHF